MFVSIPHPRTPPPKPSGCHGGATAPPWRTRSQRQGAVGRRRAPAVGPLLHPATEVDREHRHTRRPRSAPLTPTHADVAKAALQDGGAVHGTLHPPSKDDRHRLTAAAQADDLADLPAGATRGGVPEPRSLAAYEAPLQDECEKKPRLSMSRECEREARSSEATTRRACRPRLVRAWLMRASMACSGAVRWMAAAAGGAVAAVQPPAATSRQQHRTIDFMVTPSGRLNVGDGDQFAGRPRNHPRGATAGGIYQTATECSWSVSRARRRGRWAPGGRRARALRGGRSRARRE